jgi:hypothetical protein
VPIRIERHKSAAEIHGGRRLREPRLRQSTCCASTAPASGTVKQISLPPPAPAGFGATVSRDHSPSMTPDCIANIAKVGEDSTGGRPSRSA